MFGICKKALAAGLVIALGGYVFLSVDGGIAGSILFSLGLLSVCVFGLNLYTGKICYLIRKENGRVMLGNKWWFYPLVLVSNIFAAVLVGVASKTASPAVIDYAVKITNAKIAKSVWQILLSSMFCNICIFIAVHTWKLHKDFIGALAVVMAVAVFILVGAEHCIADAYYFAVAGTPILEVLPFMGVCIVGNSVGGILAKLLITGSKEE